MFANIARMFSKINPMTEPLKAKPIGGNRPVYMQPQGIHGGKDVSPTKVYADGRQRDQRLRRVAGLKVGSHFVKPQPSSHAKYRKYKREQGL